MRGLERLGALGADEVVEDRIGPLLPRMLAVPGTALGAAVPLGGQGADGSETGEVVGFPEMAGVAEGEMRSVVLGGCDGPEVRRVVVEGVAIDVVDDAAGRDGTVVVLPDRDMESALPGSRETGVVDALRAVRGAGVPRPSEAVPGDDFPLLHVRRTSPQTRASTRRHTPSASASAGVPM